MSRKVFVDLKVKLVIDMEGGVEVSDVIGEMDYNFSYPVSSGYNRATIEDTQIEDYEVVDSK